MYAGQGLDPATSGDTPNGPPDPRAQAREKGRFPGPFPPLASSRLGSFPEKILADIGAFRLGGLTPRGLGLDLFG